ncbi:MAG TPA: hypothetical protein VH079_05645 [Terriglobales bacterium]|jgi:cyanophycinase-like exopeptidase|nr:hypothetical protein [Terriglobales bacterium]
MKLTNKISRRGLLTIAGFSAGATLLAQPSLFAAASGLRRLW